MLCARRDSLECAAQPEFGALEVTGRHRRNRPPRPGRRPGGRPVVQVGRPVEKVRGHARRAATTREIRAAAARASRQHPERLLSRRCGEMVARSGQGRPRLGKGRTASTVARRVARRHSRSTRRAVGCCRSRCPSATRTPSPQASSTAPAEPGPRTCSDQLEGWLRAVIATNCSRHGQSVPAERGQVVADEGPGLGRDRERLSPETWQSTALGSIGRSRAPGTDCPSRPRAGASGSGAEARSQDAPWMSRPNAPTDNGPNSTWWRRLGRLGEDIRRRARHCRLLPERVLRRGFRRSGERRGTLRARPGGGARRRQATPRLGAVQPLEVVDRGPRAGGALAEGSKGVRDRKADQTRLSGARAASRVRPNAAWRARRTGWCEADSGRPPTSARSSRPDRPANAMSRSATLACQERIQVGRPSTRPRGRWTRAVVLPIPAAPSRSARAGLVHVAPPGWTLAPRRDRRWGAPSHGQAVVPDEGGPPMTRPRRMEFGPATIPHAVRWPSGTAPKAGRQARTAPIHGRRDARRPVRPGGSAIGRPDAASDQTNTAPRRRYRS